MPKRARTSEGSTASGSSAADHSTRTLARITPRSRLTFKSTPNTQSGNPEAVSERRSGGGAPLAGSSPALVDWLPRSIKSARSLEDVCSEEVLLRCLSFLSAHDLATVARVSSSWHRLSQDPQLWRALYLQQYASAYTRRQALVGVHIARSRPWKDLYKISTNWRNGTARSSTTVLTSTVRKAVLAPVPTDLALEPRPAPGPSTATPQETILQVHQQFLFATTRTPSSSPLEPPLVSVSQTLPNGRTEYLSCFSSSRIAEFYSTRPDFDPRIAATEMRLDEAPTPSSSSGSVLLSLFYSTGQFSIFRLDLPTLERPGSFRVTEVYTCLALSSRSPFSTGSSVFEHVKLAKLYRNLLVTCSNSFTLRFYQLSFDDDDDDDDDNRDRLRVVEIDTPVQTRESWDPVVLSIERLKTRWFRVSLVYSLPVFPDDWTVGMQGRDNIFFPLHMSLASLTSYPLTEFTINLDTDIPHISTESAICLPSSSRTSPIPRRRHTRLDPNSQDTLAPYPFRRTNTITSIEHRHPFIVTSRTDNTIQVYRIIVTPDNSKNKGKRFEIEKDQTLFGHTARVGSIAIVDPAPPRIERGGSGSRTTRGGGGGLMTTKIVSAADDGKIKVWNVSSSSSGRNKRRRIQEDDMIEIVDQRSEDNNTIEPSFDRRGTEWQQMKRRRIDKERQVEPHVDETLSTNTNEVPPDRVSKILVDQDKIVVLGQERRDGLERVKVWRFD
ncbi:F-box protein [Sporobolomyces koalae]|uniref:F-box protein n=1 Tax=Sporobolomyces koalae TaxID=500713 RepID=UPI00316E3F0B